MLSYVYPMINGLSTPLLMNAWVVIMPGCPHKMAVCTLGVCTWAGLGLRLRAWHRAYLGVPPPPSSTHTAGRRRVPWLCEARPIGGFREACLGVPWLHMVRPAWGSWESRVRAPCGMEAGLLVPAYHWGSLVGRVGPTSLGCSIVGLPSCGRAQAKLPPLPAECTYFMH